VIGHPRRFGEVASASHDEKNEVICRHKAAALNGRRNKVKIVRTIAATAAAIAAMLLPIGTSHADSTDDQYLSLLSSHGVTGPPDQLIADGHQTCDAMGWLDFGFGISPRHAAMIKLNADLAGQGFNQHDISQIMLDATRAYCPQFTPPQ
jgi:hypothetical protein